jgi:uncharacterized protein (TIGR02147 family)
MRNETDCQNVILGHYEERSSRNSSYSLRAFARDLGLSASGLSQILSGKQGLSVELAAQIADRLQMNEVEKKRVCALAESRHARSKKQRELARIRLSEFAVSPTTVQLDAFRVISEWYHFAILELTRLEGFEGTPQWIADALEINEKSAELAIERLLRLELLEKDGGQLKAAEDFVTTPSDLPSDAVKKFHDQVLEKARQALVFQSVAERDFSSVTMAVSHEDMPKAKEWIREFRRTFTRNMEANPKKDSLYQLSIQFFRLDHQSKRGK